MNLVPVTAVNGTGITDLTTELLYSLVDGDIPGQHMLSDQKLQPESQLINSRTVYCGNIRVPLKTDNTTSSTKLDIKKVLFTERPVCQ
jgi:hypothetical protein